MQDINDFHEEQLEKFLTEIRKVLEQLYLPISLENLIVYSIGNVHLKYTKEEVNYVFNSMKEELLESDTGAGEQNR